MVTKISPQPYLSVTDMIPVQAKLAFIACFTIDRVCQVYSLSPETNS